MFVTRCTALIIALAMTLVACGANDSEHEAFSRNRLLPGRSAVTNPAFDETSQAEMSLPQPPSLTVTGIATSNGDFVWPGSGTKDDPFVFQGELGASQPSNTYMDIKVLGIVDDPEGWVDGVGLQPLDDDSASQIFSCALKKGSWLTETNGGFIDDESCSVLRATQYSKSVWTSGSIPNLFPTEFQVVLYHDHLGSTQMFPTDQILHFSSVAPTVDVSGLGVATSEGFLPWSGSGTKDDPFIAVGLEIADIETQVSDAAPGKPYVRAVLKGTLIDPSDRVKRVVWMHDNKSVGCDDYKSLNYEEFIPYDWDPRPLESYSCIRFSRKTPPGDYGLQLYYIGGYEDSLKQLKDAQDNLAKVHIKVPTQ